MVVLPEKRIWYLLHFSLLYVVYSIWKWTIFLLRNWCNLLLTFSKHFETTFNLDFSWMPVLRKWFFNAFNILKNFKPFYIQYSNSRWFQTLNAIVAKVYLIEIFVCLRAYIYVFTRETTVNKISIFIFYVVCGLWLWYYHDNFCPLRIFSPTWPSRKLKMGISNGDSPLQNISRF